MLKQAVLVIGAGCFVLALLVFQAGCQTMNNLLLEHESVVEHPDYVKSYYMDDPNWWRYKEFEEIRTIIQEYLSMHPDVSDDIVIALEKIYIRKGMTKEEVALLLGQPNLIEQRNGKDLLIYTKRQGVYAKIPWDVKTFRLKFINNQLVDIEVERIVVHK